MSKNCLIHDEPITDQTDSRAHVIPSALGGRLKPKGLICGLANRTLGGAVDLPLIRAFAPIMSQLDGSRDSGKNPAVRMTDEAGESYSVPFGKPLQLTRPEFSTEDLSDGSLGIELAARTPQEMQTLLGRVRTLDPSFDIEAAMQEAVVASRQAVGKLHHQLQIGPGLTFPAGFVAANIFAAYHGHSPHPDFVSYANALNAKPAPLPPDTLVASARLVQRRRGGLAHCDPYRRSRGGPDAGLLRIFQHRVRRDSAALYGLQPRSRDLCRRCPRRQRDPGHDR